MKIKFKIIMALKKSQNIKCIDAMIKGKKL